MGQFLSNLLHVPNLGVLPSGQGTLVVSQAHGRGLIPEISTPKELLCSSDCGPMFLLEPIFPFKIVGSHWPTLAASPHLGEPPKSLKQLKMRSQWGFSQIFPKLCIKQANSFTQLNQMST